MALAGQRVLAADFETYAYDEEDADELAFSNVDPTWAKGSAVCGVTFSAPSSGVVRVDWAGVIESNTANVRAMMSTCIRVGTTIGSGSIVAGPAESKSLMTPQNSAAGPATILGAGQWRIVTGLTPGADYNAVTEHAMFAAGNGDVWRRQILVTALH